MPRKFVVPAEIIVVAKNQADAEEQVQGFLQHGMETCNDEGRFKDARLHETSDTVEIR